VQQVKFQLAKQLVSLESAVQGQTRVHINYLCIISYMPLAGASLDLRKPRCSLRCYKTFIPLSDRIKIYTRLLGNTEVLQGC
jgi:hypothetical protein